jgi:hypothetical protein
MVKDLLKAPPRILGAWDLSTGGFFNRVRVLSLPNVISSQQEVTFDDMLEEEAAKFRDVVWRNDVGAELGVVGTPIQLP